MGPFTPTGLHCQALLQEFVPRIIVIFFFFACSLAIPGKRAPSLKGNRERVDLEEWRLWGDLQM